MAVITNKYKQSSFCLDWCLIFKKATICYVSYFFVTECLDIFLNLAIV